MIFYITLHFLILVATNFGQGALQQQMVLVLTLVLTLVLVLTLDLARIFDQNQEMPSTWFLLGDRLKNGHETDLQMSPRPLGTTVFEAIYIRTMGK